MADKLTPKQERFVQEYLVDLNATAAAKRAGYSKKTAEQIGYQLLRKTSVSEKIQDAVKKRNKRTEITQDYIIEMLCEIVEKENKAGNKIRALELLGKHIGMFDGITGSQEGVQIVDDL